MMKAACLAGLAWCSSLSPVLASGGCERESSARSIEGRLATTVSVANHSSKPVVVYWIDYQGQRKYYKALAPNEAYDQPTYVTHPWVLTDITDHCLLFVEPQSYPVRAEFWDDQEPSVGPLAR